MIVKIRLYQQGGKTKMDITSKPRHQRGEHEVQFSGEAPPSIVAKLAGKQAAYFHAHLAEDRLVLDDPVEGQNW